MPQIQRRTCPYDAKAWLPGTDPVIMQIYANRGVFQYEQTDKTLARLLPPTQLGGIDQAVSLIITALTQRQVITIAGDYDCDGATATAVAYRGLHLLGAQQDQVKYIIPNRDLHGYGLSTGVIDLMCVDTSLIITVDNGVASIHPVDYAHSKGYRVLVTDHHLPGPVLPKADAIVNPNLKTDQFPSKTLAGVGVMFYVLAAVRAALKERQLPGGDADLTTLLDLVAIGTLADLVPLDQNNRILVEAGLRRIRYGKAHAGVNALLQVAHKDVHLLTSTDIGFAIAPRLNAAGRLAEMSLGVQLLICDDLTQAEHLALQLERLNQDRKDIQAQMLETAHVIVEHLPPSNDHSIVVYDPSWHHGIVGLVASKLKESLHRPVVAFAPAGIGSEELRGSARSIKGLHLRDVLANIDARHPGLITKFGGHAMAAGLSIPVSHLKAFTDAFNQTVKEQLPASALESVLYTDAELLPHQMSVEFCQYLETCGPWGQGFPKPVFDGVFEVKTWKVLGQQHIKFELHDVRNGDVNDAIWFFSYQGTPPPTRFLAAYELSINSFRGQQACQLILQAVVEVPET